jgi:RNA polymerase sigma-70 factor (ECF subfamily)
MTDEGGGSTDLVSAARSGDRAALVDLLESYRGRLRRIAGAALDDALRSKVDASDVVQDALVKAHGGFARFRGGSEGELLAWLERILRRTLLDLRRRYRNAGRAVGRERPLDRAASDSSPGLARLLAANGSSPSGRAVRRERDAAIAEALGRLSAPDREVVILRSLRELSWGEIARRLRSTPDATRVRWARALRRLGRFLGEAP